MSNMSGVDALIEIRKINPHLPVIAVSAFATEKDKNKYSDFGFTDFISKPISIDLFMQTINNNI
jgi:CheY-like chemotaxis protein